ncbi:MAG TPA: 2-succinyl-5-enolpyruvyl-6-hydroxy-3-cyclohexene-1-carboxylic-acid synthase [Solirubrobacteraceae bacterium]|nr:2-succinyl-5-enolpyruvyl-6-hydroxy-3-cyclohexene-1-carboxylic-acid synthase [Solirubrobacteraceae bacterium]
MDQHDLIAAFVDELARLGMTDCCTSPGSRSTPLTLALARHDRLRAHSHIDERSSAFFALGAAKASGRPVAIACTSGTAAANFMPAVIEASQARVPLIVLTADRPPELRGVGAGQTIDQIKLYGDAVRWFFEVGSQEPTEASLAWVRALACRAWAAATGPQPGPVHLNWPLRDPLVPGRPKRTAPGGRSDGRPWVEIAPRAARAPLSLREHIEAGARGVIVAGRDDAGLSPEIPALAAAAGYPLLADPLSGARRGPAAIAAYDALLREPTFAGDHAPEVVVRVGDLPTSKPLREWLAAASAARQILVEEAPSWQDPACVADVLLRADPRTLQAPERAPSDWLASWRAADERAQAAIDRELGEELSEPNLARTLAAALPAKATLFVAASMPVRELEWFAEPREDSPRVLSNRGANGIDGTLAAALGVASVAGAPVVALIGDVAFAHDMSSLLSAARLDIPLTIVLIDNGGSAVFDHLAISGEHDVYEQHIATPTGLDFAAAAALYGLDHVAPSTLAQLRELAAEPPPRTLIQIQTDRAEGLALHARVWSATRLAVAASQRA